VCVWILSTNLAETIFVLTRGSFKKFCTLYVFSLKMNLFYKIHLHAFNVISIVLYHSGPAFGQVLYSCLDAFVVDASDYSGHLIRHLLKTTCLNHDSFDNGVLQQTCLISVTARCVLCNSKNIAETRPVSVITYKCCYFVLSRLYCN
jgi:hypothetical protein